MTHAGPPTNTVWSRAAGYSPSTEGRPSPGAAHEAWLFLLRTHRQPIAESVYAPSALHEIDMGAIAGQFVEHPI